jgi:peptide/nickel transport system substrate-binding protein
VVSRGIETPIPSAGPFYLASLRASSAVLRRNPNYSGPRPQRVDAIVFHLGVPAGKAAARIAKGTLDYMVEFDAALAPDGAAARAAGDRYRLTPDGTGGVKFIGLNWARSLFADARLRRAVQYALDRSALAALDGNRPATRLLSPRVLGYEATPLYPARPNLAAARRLAGPRPREGVFLTFLSGPRDEAFVRTVREALAPIGVTLKVVRLTSRDFANGAAGARAKARRADLYWGGATANGPDPVDYLRGLALPPADAAELARLDKLRSPRREAAAAALARRLEREALFAVYKQDRVPELVSPRLGCIVHQPQYAGVDLAALCLRRNENG